MTEQVSNFSPDEEGKKGLNIPGLKIVEETEIVDDNGKLVFDLQQLIVDGWDESQCMIATPNIPIAKLDALKNEMNILSDPENLDLRVTIFDKLVENNPVEADYWNIGYDDGSRRYVSVYPKEFFQSHPDAQKVFEQKIVPEFFRQ